MTATPGRRSRLYQGLLLLSILLIGLLHTFTPGDRIVLHDIYRRISYFPIVVAALLYGVRGGLLAALFTSIAFIPHLRHFYLLGPSAYLSELPEILVYFGAGLVVGVIAGREKKLRIRYQHLSNRLERSYKKLHAQASLLVKAEEELRLSQKLSALGRLSASLVHEIKNPLASIRGSVEILADDFPPDHPRHEFAQILLKETGRLSQTVEEMLRFSRQRSDQPQKRNLEPLTRVLERAATLLDNQFRKNGIDLHLDLSGGSGDFPVDGDRMAQVFINLMLNSCEAMEQGGWLRISAVRDRETMKIIFTDNGPGIATEDRDRIFEPFYTTRHHGTGLGLAISSRIVESQGGTITVDERSGGGGTVFTISLPLVPAAAESGGRP